MITDGGDGTPIDDDTSMLYMRKRMNDDVVEEEGAVQFAHSCEEFQFYGDCSAILAGTCIHTVDYAGEQKVLFAHEAAVLGTHTTERFLHTNDRTYYPERGKRGGATRRSAIVVSARSTTYRPPLTLLRLRYAQVHMNVPNSSAQLPSVLVVRNEELEATAVTMEDRLKGQKNYAYCTKMADTEDTPARRLMSTIQVVSYAAPSFMGRYK